MTDAYLSLSRGANLMNAREPGAEVAVRGGRDTASPHGTGMAEQGCWRTGRLEVA